MGIHPPFKNTSDNDVELDMAVRAGMKGVSCCGVVQEKSSSAVERKAA